MTSLSELAGNLGYASLPSVDCARFEFLLPLPTASGVAVSGAAVLVSTWHAWAVSALAGKVGYSSQSVSTLGENSGMSG